MVSFDDFSRVHCDFVDAANESVENAIKIRENSSSVDVERKLLLKISAIIDSKDKKADDVSDVSTFVVASQSTVKIRKGFGSIKIGWIFQNAYLTPSDRTFATHIKAFMMTGSLMKFVGSSSMQQKVLYF